jgi:hypothetical protein
VISHGVESGEGECRRRGRDSVSSSSERDDWKERVLWRVPEVIVQLVWELKFGDSMVWLCC